MESIFKKRRISHRLAGENLKGSTVTARAYVMVSTWSMPAAY